MQHVLMPNRDIRSDSEGMPGSVCSTALNHTLTLFSRMTVPMTEVVSAMKGFSPRNSGTRSFSR